VVQIYPPGAQIPTRSASNTPPPSTHTAPAATATTKPTQVEDTLLDIPPHTEAEQTTQTLSNTSRSAQASDDNNGKDEDDEEKEEILLAEISLPRAGDAQHEA
jgi:hypothetical protein